MAKTTPHVKIYHGYGYAGHMQVYGHVFGRNAPHLKQVSGRGFFANLRQLLSLFSVRTLPFVDLELEFQGEFYRARSQVDGFFQFQWTPQQTPAPGWHTVKVRAEDSGGQLLSQAEGKVFVIRKSRYVFISDIDDTVIKSYSATVIRRVYELLSRNSLQRKTFEGVVEFYTRLSEFHTETHPNPFFYVSSSEWNLYEYLKALFRHQHLPEGIFLLNPIKTLRQVLNTGRSGHEGKHARILRILKALPVQKMVLIGDNSQQDPDIYTRIAAKYPGRIHAIFIRNVRYSRTQATENLLRSAEKNGIHCLLFNHSKQALMFARKILEPSRE